MNPKVTHQTVRLGRGRHSSPARGACVMELASMLSGGPFTDHPRCACPVIGAFLRSYNDWVDDGRRQELYAYAARVVDSRASGDVEEARATRLTEWTEELETGRLKRSWFRLARCVKVENPRPDDIASRAVCAISHQKDDPHELTLALLDELLEMGRTERPLPALTPGEPQPMWARARRSPSSAGMSPRRSSHA